MIEIIAARVACAALAGAFGSIAVGTWITAAEEFSRARRYLRWGNDGVAVSLVFSAFFSFMGIVLSAIAIVFLVLAFKLTST